jgi:hypothetical protein
LYKPDDEEKDQKSLEKQWRDLNLPELAAGINQQ